MRIREALHTDLDLLSSLFNSYRMFYRKQSNQEAAKSFLSQRLQNQDSEIFVCELGDGELTGFVQLYPLFSSTRMAKFWLLNDLFVHQNHRGKGISIQLIERAKQLVQDTNACGMYLETEKNNTIGNQLYPRTEFKMNDYANFYEWDNPKWNQK